MKKTVTRSLSILTVVASMVLAPLAQAVTPNDPLFGNAWGLDNVGQVVPGVSTSLPGVDIDAVGAWDVNNTSERVIVAVIDTGVAYNHPDLADNMWDGSACVDEFNSAVAGGCPNHGWDFVNNDNDPVDENGRGTNIAGVIGAVGNNGVGITGVSWDVQLMALRATDAPRNAQRTNIISAINFAENNGAKIIVLNSALPDASQEEEDAIAAFEGLVVVPAKEGATVAGDADGNLEADDGQLLYPAAYDLANILTVTAIGPDDHIASSWGPTTVDVAAPGVGIETTSMTGDYEISSAVAELSAAFTAGQAALLMDRNPLLSTALVKTIIMETVDTNGGLPGEIVSGGRINLWTSLLVFRPYVQFISAEADASGVVTIRVTSQNTFEGMPIRFSNFQYSVDGGITFVSPNNGDNSGSFGPTWRNQSSEVSGDEFGEEVFEFTWNTRHSDLEGLNGVAQEDVQIRFFGHDGTRPAEPVILSPSFRVDNSEVETPTEEPNTEEPVTPPVETPAAPSGGGGGGTLRLNNSPGNAELLSDEEYCADIEGHWSEDYVKALIDMGAFEVDEDGNCNPDTQFHRAGMTRLSLNLFGPTVAEALNGAEVTEKPFEDVGLNHPYLKDIYVGKLNNIVRGYGLDGTMFKPDVVPTRAEALQILAEAGGYNFPRLLPNTIALNSDHPFKALLAKFVDIKWADAWYNHYLSWALEKEFIEGYSDKTARPDQPVTVAEAAKMAYVIHQYKTVASN